MSRSISYEAIGQGYALGRRPDPRLARAIDDALGDAATVVNVGAGTGNYEPPDRRVVAVEPAAVMVAQRPPSAGPALRGSAEALPVRTGWAEASLALSTVHHWTDLAAGLAEMARVAPRRVVYFSEPAAPGGGWLVDDYFPEIVAMGINRSAPTVERVAAGLGGTIEVRAFPVPSDFAEASAGAFWNRPEAYCDPTVQAAMSMFALLAPDVVARGTACLRDDLASGAWDDRHGHLRAEREHDVGYRIVVSTS